MLLRRLLFPALLFSATTSDAVINALPEEPRSTVEIQSGNGHRCSAVIVGTEPLTLMTATSCVANKASVAIQHLSPDIEVKLRTTVIGRLLSVLIFDRSAPRAGVAAPIARLTNGSESVSVCGFGYESHNVAPSVATCGPETLVKNPYELSSYLPDEYRERDPKLYKFYANELRSSQRLAGADVVGISRKLYTRYALEDPMPTRGDIGGPWFLSDSLNRKRLFAITFKIHYLTRRNEEWIIFSDRTAKAYDLPYAALGIRLDHRESRDVVDRARKAGAAIHFN